MHGSNLYERINVSESKIILITSFWSHKNLLLVFLCLISDLPTSNTVFLSIYKLIPRSSKRFFTDESSFVLEIDGYKSHTINKVGFIEGDIIFFHLEYKITEVTSQFSVIEYSHEIIFFKAVIPMLGNIYVEAIYRYPNTTLN